MMKIILSNVTFLLCGLTIISSGSSLQAAETVMGPLEKCKVAIVNEVTSYMLETVPVSKREFNTRNTYCVADISLAASSQSPSADVSFGDFWERNLGRQFTIVHDGIIVPKIPCDAVDYLNPIRAKICKNKRAAINQVFDDAGNLIYDSLGIATLKHTTYPYHCRKLSTYSDFVLQFPSFELEDKMGAILCGIQQDELSEATKLAIKAQLTGLADKFYETQLPSYLRMAELLYLMGDHSQNDRLEHLWANNMSSRETIARFALNYKLYEQLSFAIPDLMPWTDKRITELTTSYWSVVETQKTRPNWRHGTFLRYQYLMRLVMLMPTDTNFAVEDFVKLADDDMRVEFVHLLYRNEFLPPEMKPIHNQAHFLYGSVLFHAFLPQLVRSVQSTSTFYGNHMALWGFEDY